MWRYAQNSYELGYANLVMWEGEIFAFWDDCDEHNAKLVPLNVLTAYDGDESRLDDKTVTVPIRQIQLPEPVKSDRITMQALFRLDAMPWDLMKKGLYPFSSATSRYEFTEEDLLCVIDRLPMFRNSFLLEAWRKSFFPFDDPGVAPRLRIPEEDKPGFTLAYLARNFFSMMDWYDPEEYDWQYVWELRDCYLQSRGKPLAETVLPKSFKSDMVTELEDYCKKHPVTDEIREYYVRLLDECLENGDSDEVAAYAYAYYGGNAIVPCDWRKSEQALLTLFNPDDDPLTGIDWAANSLGYIYGSNRLGEPDYRKAFICFSFAAEYGMTEAKYKLSDLYRMGLGTEKDPGKAWAVLSRLYRKTDKRRISQGKYADIALRMGYCYRDGIGVAPDNDMALKFFLDAKRGIEARLKRHPEYGDETVARNIQAAIESVRKKN